MEKMSVKIVVVQISQTRVVCGFNNQDLPSLTLPAQYLTYKSEQEPESTSEQGSEASNDSIVKVFDKWDMLARCQDPTAEVYQLYDKQGLPCDWDVMDEQWSYMFKRLGLKFEDYPVCVVLPNELKASIRKKFVEHLLGYGIPMVQLLNEPVCNTLSQGRPSGIVVDIGHTGVRVDAVIDGVLFKQYRKENKIGGAFLNWKICDHLLKRDANKSTEVWRDATEWLPTFKNTMLQVSPIELDANHEIAPHYQHMVSPMDHTKSFLLERKQTVTFTNKQLYAIGELLFKPVINIDKSGSTDTADSTAANGSTNGGDAPPPEKLIGIVGLIRSCIQSLLNGANAGATTGASAGGASNSGDGSLGGQGSNDSSNAPSHNYTSEQLQSMLLTNILVTGSTSNIQGLEQRLLNDISVSLNDLTTVRPKILFKPTKLDRTFQSWQAATTLCRLPLRESLYAWETLERETK